MEGKEVDFPDSGLSAENGPCTSVVATFPMGPRWLFS
nr:hypothetical protein [Tanacetum cinerariifolium]